MSETVPSDYAALGIRLYEMARDTDNRLYLMTNAGWSPAHWHTNFDWEDVAYAVEKSFLPEDVVYFSIDHQTLTRRTQDFFRALGSAKIHSFALLEYGQVIGFAFLSEADAIIAQGIVTNCDY